MTYYEILGVARNATQDEIRTAYRDLARRFHPDALGEITAETRNEVEEKLKAINAAYHTLGDPKRRQAYHSVMWTRSDPARQYPYRPSKNGHAGDEKRGVSNGAAKGNSQTAALHLEIMQAHEERARLLERQGVKRRHLWVSAGLTSLMVYFLIAFGARLYPSPADLLPLTLYFLGGELITLSIILNVSGMRFPHFPFAGSPVAFSLTITLGALVTCSSVPRFGLNLAAPTSLYNGMAISVALLIHAYLASRLGRLQEVLFAEEIRRIDHYLEELEQRVKSQQSRR